MSISLGIICFLISIVCNVTFSVFLKQVRVYNIEIKQVILGNYLSAMLLCWLCFSEGINYSITYLFIENKLVWVISVFLGILLPLVFISMEKSLYYFGLIRSELAQRLSLVLSILTSFFFFNERITINKLFAIFLTFFSLNCLLNKYSNKIDFFKKNTGIYTWKWLLLVCIGYGIIDILLKITSQVEIEIPSVLFISFGISCLLTLANLLICKNGVIYWKIKNMIFGIILGFINFSNILAYINTHKYLPNNPIMIYSMMNVGIIILGSFIGKLLFNESLTKLTYLGLILAIMAIILMTL